MIAIVINYSFNLMNSWKKNFRTWKPTQRNDKRNKSKM